MRLCQKLLSALKQDFVPNSVPAKRTDVDKLQVFLSEAQKLLVLTGAGLSTESGIPDYRSEGVGLYARTDRRPIQYQEFINSSSGRQRYWARNFVGWPQFASFHPNIAHQTLAEWEQKGKVSWLVTQNVDSLHAKAGHERLTELHGCSHRCVCLSCRSAMHRWDLQTLFQEQNPEFKAESLDIAPDGDVILTDEQVKGFKVPDCQNCGGILKPDIIFFGDNVPRPVVDFVFEQVQACDSLLVAGSSLYVYSGYRLLQRAAQQGKKIAILNIGATRADHLAHVKVEAQCGEVLAQLTVD